MPEEREEWITKRAYALWEQAGRPDGQDSEHWHQASRDCETRDPSSEPVRSSPANWDEEKDQLN